MPIYEYACKACSAKFEKLVRSMTHEEPAECPSCGSKQTARELSVFAVAGDGGSKSSAAPGCERCGGPGPCGMQ